MLQTYCRSIPRILLPYWVASRCELRVINTSDLSAFTPTRISLVDVTVWSTQSQLCQAVCGNVELWHHAELGRRLQGSLCCQSSADVNVGRKLSM